MSRDGNRYRGRHCDGGTDSTSMNSIPLCHYASEDTSLAFPGLSWGGPFLRSLQKWGSFQITQPRHNTNHEKD